MPKRSITGASLVVGFAAYLLWRVAEVLAQYFWP